MLVEVLAASEAVLRIGFPLAVESEDGKLSAPSEVHLLPKGKSFTDAKGNKLRKVETNDGRTILYDPEEIVASLKAGDPIPIDTDHVMEGANWLLGPHGEAQGWISELKKKGDGIWGFIGDEWTEDGAALVVSKKYRKQSPSLVLDFDRCDFSTRTYFAIGFSSVALTNRPALQGQLKMLASQQPTPDPDPAPGVKAMDPKILAALGLTATATVEQAVEAIATLAAGNRAMTQELAKLKDAALVSTVDGLVAAQKITPAQRDKALAMARKVGAEEFAALYADAPVVGPAPGRAAPDGNPPETPTASKSDSDLASLAKAAGMTEDQYVAHREELRKKGEIR